MRQNVLPTQDIVPRAGRYCDPFISQMVKEKELAADGRETPSGASSTASSSFSFASHGWARFNTTVDLERTNAAMIGDRWVVSPARLFCIPAR